ncbi:MAG: ACT domain-containing protein [Actinobacteria bacterium]|jgi:glycine cleavage system transcriptional repressor|nr:ACT domain-containing protein [Actinomycetota bacterium]
MSHSLAVTVLGHDRPGIIAEVTGVLAELGGNLEDSSMTLLRGHFAWTLVVAADADPSEIEARLAHLVAEGLVVSVLPVPDADSSSTSGSPWLLTVHGADRPGIVSGLTGVVAAAGGNITDLTTRLGTGLYLLVAEAALPTGTDVEALQARIAEAAAELGVHATLQPADVDEL